MPLLRLFIRLVIRPLRREPGRTSLTVLAVALGVAVVLAIELAGSAAAGSFRSSMETLTGRSSFEITATGGIAPEVLTRLAQLPEAFQLEPRIEDYAFLAGRTVPLIGIDLLSSDGGWQHAGDAGVVARADSVWTGDGLKYHEGDPIRLMIDDRAVDAVVRGEIKDAGDAIIMDLAPASRLLRRGGKLDRILVGVPAGKGLEEWEREIRKVLPAGVSCERTGTGANENRRMLEAFRWNLRVLSYIALVVGAFLIYNTISVSVVRRRAEIGVMRALGATRGAVRVAFLGEAAALGLLGGLAGIGVGLLMAQGAVKLVAATVESLYVSSSPAPITLSWGLALATIATGVGVAVLSAALPAWEASQVTPVEAMARGLREHAKRLHRWRDLGLAAVTGLAAWVAARQGPIGGKPIFGYIAAALLIGASALSIPALAAGACGAIASISGRFLGVEALLASHSLRGSLRRTSVLVGALATAIAIMVAVGIMVGSFRQTVMLWMEDRLQADLYLRPAVPASADRHPTMAPDAADRVERLREVAAVDRFRAYEISYQGLPATLGGGEARIAGRYGKRPFLSGAPPGEVFRKLTQGDNVIISEPFANKHHTGSGDELELSLGGRRVRFRVLDVYYDYSTERGYIVMDRSTLLRYLSDTAPSNAAVYLKAGVSLEAGRRAVERALAGSRVMVFTNRSLRADAIATFDRTFAITYALEAVAVMVAVMGVAGALLALVIDRRREFGLLRFLGAGAPQIRRMILYEAGLLGLLANAAGMALGLLLSILLIRVINRQSFGWTIQFHWPIGVLLGALSVVYAATVMAGMYPARMATQLNPIEVVHED